MTEKPSPEAHGEYDGFRTLTWIATDHDPGRFDWVELTNGRPPRFRRRSDIPTQQIGILTAKRPQLDEFQERWNGIQAVACLDTDGRVSVGYDPDGEPLFGPDPAEASHYALGVSIHATGAHAVIGVWVPKEGFFVDHITALHEQKTSPELASQTFPGVSIVQL